MDFSNKKTAILGAGNIGCSIANGLTASDIFKPSQQTLTRRRTDKLSEYTEKGYNVTSDNIEAVKNSDILIACVERCASHAKYCYRHP
jgi:pyrroline-5-carboxylate reductase